VFLIDIRTEGEQNEIQGVFDLEYLRAHEVKDIPNHLQGWLFKLSASPVWPVK